MKLTTTIKGSLVALIAAAISACGTGETNESTQISQVQAPQVTVAQVVNERLTEWDTFTGRLEAPETVNLRPRVSGYIDQITFEEGAYVEAGQTLILIDDRPFKAEVKRFEASLASAHAQLRLATSEFERASNLITQKAISAELLDSRAAQLANAKAQVASVSASLELAQLQLSYTRIDAPISGRVSNALVTKGNYVNAGQSTLTTLVSTEKVYAYFDADEQTYLNYVKLSCEGSRPSSRTHENPVVMSLANENDFPHQGYIDFVDNQLNPRSGTIRGRAVFDNSNDTFIPGLFARIKLIGSATYEGILIDDKAIGTDLNNKFVLVLNDQNTVEYRAVTLGEKVNGLRIIKSGLQPKEYIVVNGLQRVRPGTPVTPRKVDMASKATITALKHTQHTIDESFKRAALSKMHNSTEVVGG
ncbi:efflux RND transporter periplasmic adaptor subunit [Agaribacter marinus]|uniref:MexE family multidrug efflux RND transporter periplasmic adaptor subunit n=1 Tax=Agaribacter marinus TaxID=1431249 RepID=A0AA37SZ54_9ALTE|nr:efflux RND transporter periplasmic adaptor subunit [Agaribacter marinus]GLR71004.1 MexE family multidrug efflux RND transporter periplasmic adaptor subunit [Agaribacter marinus]